jgi:D-alanyl-D-alanine carboxypeptidase
MIPLYSISKPFLAQAVLELGADLATPVGDIVAGLPEVLGRRKLGQLLNHTSGLSDYGPMPEYQLAVSNNESAWARAELIQRVAGLAHELQGFNYSNIGYFLLRLAVEQQTGLSYYESLKWLVFNQLDFIAVAPWEKTDDWHFEDKPIELQNYDPKWVYSGTFLAEPEALKVAFAKLVKLRMAGVGLEAGNTLLDYPDTGMDQPAYNYGFMSDGRVPKFVGHGGGGPGLGLMILGRPSADRFELEYQFAGGFDQTAAIKRLRVLAA